MAKIGTATVGVIVKNITGKVLISSEVYNRLKNVVDQISEDEEMTLALNLELRRVVREIVAEAEVA